LSRLVRLTLDTEGFCSSYCGEYDVRSRKKVWDVESLPDGVVSSFGGISVNEVLRIRPEGFWKAKKDFGVNSLIKDLRRSQNEEKGRPK
ncbi:MAG TPA: hypothetical protein VGO47_06985, partial [Chlamydiales bacterium]|nr:hypothetical protein [Chlamydiales bacterium]